MSTIDVDKEYARITKKLTKWERKEQKQLEHQAFVDKHMLECFQCGTTINEWGQTGMKNGHAWARCVTCLRDSWRNK